MSERSSPLVLAIDSGTSGCKVLAVDPGVGVLAETFARHTLLQARPGWAEQDAEEWWTSAVAAIQRLPRLLRRRVACVTVTSQREGLVPVDSSVRPLAPCMVWLDRRAESELLEIERRISPEELFRLTGLRPEPAFSLPRLLWLRRHQPDLLRAAASLLQPGDFLLARLSGRFVTDMSLASRTSLLDVQRRVWSERLLELFEVERPLLPELVEPGTTLGHITPTAAEALGVPRDVFVVAGAGDQQAMALGAGAYRSETAAVSLGTSTSVVAMTEKPVLDRQMRMLCNCSAVASGWDVQAPVWTTGVLLEWFTDLTGHVASRLITDALRVAPGAEGVVALPHFAGGGAPGWRSAARGGFLGLTLGHRSPHLVRAVLEAIVYEIRENVTVAAELAGPIQRVALSGGLTQDDELLRVIASMLGMPVVTHATSSTAALGVCANAAVECGLAEDLTSALAPARRLRQVVEPDPDLTLLYERLTAERPETVRRLVAAID